MLRSEKLKTAREKGFQISDKDIRLAKREERRKSRPIPVKPDPLHELIEKLVKEIKIQGLAQTVSTDKIITEVTDALVKGLEILKPEPKPKEWRFKAKDPNGKLKYTINAKEVMK